MSKKTTGKAASEAAEKARIEREQAEAAKQAAADAEAAAKQAAEEAEREQAEAEEAERVAAAAAANEERERRIASERTVPMRRKIPAYAGDQDVVEALPDEVEDWKAAGWIPV